MLTELEYLDEKGIASARFLATTHVRALNGMVHHSGLNPVLAVLREYRLTPDERKLLETTAADMPNVDAALNDTIAGILEIYAPEADQEIAFTTETLDVEGETATFTVLDDQTVEITISVTRKDPSRPAVCIVRARSYDGAETGRREVLVGPSEAKTVQVTTTVKSYRRPVVGDIYGCGIDVPEYLLGG